MGTWKTFEEIEAYRLARELRKRISAFCKTLPKEEEYRLKDQIVRFRVCVGISYWRRHDRDGLESRVSGIVRA